MKKILISTLLIGFFSTSCKTEAPKIEKTPEAVKVEKVEPVVKKVEVPVKKEVAKEVTKAVGGRHTPKTTWADYKNEAVLAPEKANEKAPKKFKAKFKTSQGDIVLEVNRKWAPNGADRFYNLVKIGYFDDIAMFRAVPGFMIQFGIHGNPAVSDKWKDAKIKDDVSIKDASNTPGMITFATAGKDTRTTQLFINLGNNSRLDMQGFTPFGKVVEGMEVVKKLNTEYGENSPGVQGGFQAKGNAFISQRYPNLDYILSAEIVK